MTHGLLVYSSLDAPTNRFYPLIISPICWSYESYFSQPAAWTKTAADNWKKEKEQHLSLFHELSAWGLRIHGENIMSWLPWKQLICLWGKHQKPVISVTKISHSSSSVSMTTEEATSEQTELHVQQLTLTANYDWKRSSAQISFLLSEMNPINLQIITCVHIHTSYQFAIKCLKVAKTRIDVTSERYIMWTSFIRKTDQPHLSIINLNLRRTKIKLRADE